MLEFLHAFVLWLSTLDIMPPEADATTTEDRTYLMSLPDTPDNVYFIQQYNEALNSLIAPDTCVRYLQIIVRNKEHLKCIEQSTGVFDFLKKRPDFIEEMPNGQWILINCPHGIKKLEEDAQGRFSYSLSFNITTKS